MRLTERQCVANLRHIEAEIESIVALIRSTDPSGRLHREEVAKERLRSLKQWLEEEHRLYSQVKAEKNMSEFERDTYGPAIQDVLHNNGVSDARLNSRPDRWSEPLHNALYTIRHHLSWLSKD